MSSKILYLAALALPSLFGTVHAKDSGLAKYECTGGVNEKQGIIGSPDPVYWAPSSQQNVAFFLNTELGCKAKSGNGFDSVKISFRHGSKENKNLRTVDCDSLTADGQWSLIQCSIQKGQVIAGPVALIVKFANVKDSENVFTVTHEQIKTTLPTPTSTFYTTPTEEAIQTVWTTETSTEYSAQQTVTRASQSITNIILETPRPTKVVSTSTVTLTKVQTRYTLVKTTVTSQFPCPTGAPKRCQEPAPIDKRNGGALIARITSAPVAAAIAVRDAPNPGCGPEGPLTITITPDAVSTTLTADPTTTTITTVSTYTPAFTTTLPNPTPTTTIYEGVDCTTTTSTLPQATYTKVKTTHTRTTVKTTSTFTQTRTQFTRPTDCAR